MGINLGKLLKQAAPIAIGAFAPGMMPAGMNPFLASALASGIGGAVLGQKPKDALKSAILGGIAGGAMDSFSSGADKTGIMKAQSTSPSYDDAILRQNRANKPSINPVVTPTGETMSGKLLAKFPTLAGTQDDPSILFNILNSNLGEGVAAGLLAQLLAGDDEEEE